MMTTTYINPAEAHQAKIIAKICVNNAINISCLRHHYDDFSTGQQFSLLSAVVRYIDDNWSLTKSTNTHEDVKFLVRVLDYYEFKHKLYVSHDVLARQRTIERQNQRDEKLMKMCEDLEPQMFGMKEFREDITKELREFKDGALLQMGALTNSVNATSVTYKGLAERFAGFVEETKIKLMSYMKFAPLATLVAKLIAFSYLCSRPEYADIKSLTALVVLILPTSSVGSFSLPSQENLSRAVQGLLQFMKGNVRKLGTLTVDTTNDITQKAKGVRDNITNSINNFKKDYGGADSPIRYFRKPTGDEVLLESLVTQGPEDHTDCIPETECLISTIFHLTKSTLGGLFMSQPPKEFKNFELRTKKMRIISDLVRSSKTIWEMIMAILEKVMSYFSDHMLESWGMAPSKLPVVKDLIEEYHRCLEDGTFENAALSSIVARRVLTLRSNLRVSEAYLAKTMVTKTTYARIQVFPYIQAMLKKLDTIIDQIPPHLKHDANSARNKPFFLYTYGDPRSGKSALWQPVIASELARALKIRTRYEDVANYSHYRNCGYEFWDGYFGQPIVQYNDLFQDFADKEKMHIAMLELTNVVDDNPFNLNFAYLEKKGQVYFTSPIVIANAQADIIGKPWLEGICLSGGKHIFARRNLVVKFCLADKYVAASGTGIDHKILDAAMKDPNLKKVGNPANPLFPEEMYEVHFTDPVTGAHVETYNFTDAIKKVCDDAVAFVNSQDGFKARLQDFMKYQWEEDVQYNAPVPLQVKKQPHAPFVQRSNQQQQQTTNWSSDDDDDQPITTTTQVKHSPYRLGIGRGKPPINTQGFGDILARIRGTNVPVEPITFITPEEDRILKEMIELKSPLTTPIYTQPFTTQRTTTDVPRYEFEDTDECMCAAQTDLLFRQEMINYETSIKLLTWSRGAHDCDKYHEVMFGNGDLKRDNFYRDALGAATQCEIENEKLLSGIPWWGIFMTALGGLTMFLAGFALYKFFNQEEKEEIPVTQSHEGNVKPAVRRIQRKKLQTQMYDMSNVDVERMIRTNFVQFRLYTTREGEEEKLSHYMNGICVAGDVFVLPRHFWCRVRNICRLHENTNVSVRLEVNFSMEKKTTVHFDTLTEYEPEYEHLNDLIFIRIKHLCCMRNISTFFQKENDDPSLYGCYLYGVRNNKIDQTNTPTKMGVGMVSMMELKYTSLAGAKDLYGNSLDFNEFILPQGYIYNEATTMIGDCGMLLLTIDSRSNCRKIIGMHTAGNTSTGVGVSSVLMQEDIKEAIEYFSKNSAVVYLQSDSKYMSQCLEPTGAIKDMLVESGIDVVGTTSDYITSSGKTAKIKLSLPSKTKIVPSVVFDAMENEFGPHLTKPARLRSFKNKEGDVISPLAVGVKKLAKYSPMVPQKMHDQIMQHIKETVDGWQTQASASERRILTDEETINGLNGLKSLDLSTSAGFPYILNSKTTGKGKRPWFTTYIKKGQTMYKMNDELNEIVHERIEKAKIGEVMETYFVDTLKDETRPNEKVELGKTRLFQVGPMDLSIAMRKYFGMFIDHCQSSFLEGEMAIGVNPNSRQWQIKWKKFQTIAKKFLNGDYKNFDATLMFQMCMGLADLANHWYNDGPENALIRTTLMATCVSTFHIIEDVIFFFMQGNPSGINMTSILNCFCNMYAFRYAFMDITGMPLTHYLKLVMAWFYGDDNTASVHTKIQDKFTMPNLVKSLAKLGLEYTSVFKGEIVQDFVELEDINFLKRTFTPVDGNVLARLDHDVITEIPRWSESDPTRMIDQMQRFASALLEISNYGENEFTEMRMKFSKMCAELRELNYNISATDLPTYEECRAICDELYLTTQMDEINETDEVPDLMDMDESFTHCICGQRSSSRVRVNGIYVTRCAQCCPHCNVVEECEEHYYEGEDLSDDWQNSTDTEDDVEYQIETWSPPTNGNNFSHQVTQHLFGVRSGFPRTTIENSFGDASDSFATLYVIQPRTLKSLCTRKLCDMYPVRTGLPRTDYLSRFFTKMSYVRYKSNCSI